MSDIKKLTALTKHGVNVIVETPKDSQNKFEFDDDLDMFRLSKALPMGTVFPFDFGFIPHTEGEDGDPLDVLVIMDPPSFPGCVVECRILGVFTAMQSKKNGKMVRNDRFIAVATTSTLYKDVDDIKALNKAMVSEMENFFVDYNKHQGKKFSPGKWLNKKEAEKMIKDAANGK